MSAGPTYSEIGAVDLLHFFGTIKDDTRLGAGRRATAMCRDTCRLTKRRRAGIAALQEERSERGSFKKQDEQLGHSLRKTERALAMETSGFSFSGSHDRLEH